jgi:hemolysin III
MAENQITHLKNYSTGEEIMNGITHGIGAGLSIAGLVILVVLAALYGDPWHIVSFSIFGATLIILYSASMLYHSIPGPRAKTILKKLDHSAIYLLIAGTYTPFVLVSIRGAWGWSIFGVVWALALFGIAMKFISVFRFQKLAIALYLFMGWLGVIAAKEIAGAISTPSLVLLVAGGLSYTAGVIFYALRKMPFNHGVWHIFVLCGSVSHFFSVLCILPRG